MYIGLDHVQVGKLAPPLGHCTTGLCYLGTCYLGYCWRVKFLVLLLNSLQLQSYLVLCILPRIFIIPKLRNIHWRQIFYAISELFSLSLSLYTSNIFRVLIFMILLDLPHLLTLSNGTGVLGNTFPELYQLKWFSIYFDQFVQYAFHVIALQVVRLIRGRLLSNGFRSVFKWMQLTKEPP